MHGKGKTATRIRKSSIVARLEEVGSNQRGLAAALNIHPPGVTQLLHGARRLSAREAELAAQHLRWSLEDVYMAFGMGQKGYGKLPVWGYIDASSGSIIDRASVEPTAPLEEIDAPFPGYIGRCVKIKGSSMAPRYRDGEAIGFTFGDHDILGLINNEAVIETVDGRLLLKILHRGDRPHRYTLTSLNAGEEPILNIEIERAAPVDWHLPRRI